MKIFKPDSLGMLYRSFRFAGRNSLAIGMMAYFHIDRSNPAELLPEADMWVAVAQALGADGILDEGLPKPVAEFKAYGAAHAPQGTHVTELAAGVRIGAIDKTLLVSGDRHFNAAGLISETQPYARMPITAQTAFGGAGFADNPLGKGVAVIEGPDGKVWPLPNIEMPQRRIANRRDRAEPAGFWGFDAASAQRQCHLGRFNERWIKREWPHLPEDTRPEFFLTAPLDQRLPGWFAGDEALEMRNLHPQRALIHSNLPRIRARCFVNCRSVEGTEIFSEIEARAETVWLFPEQECGIVLYRALTSVRNDTADDVLHLMAEWEPMDSSPQSFEHYRGVFQDRLREDMPPAAAAAFPAAAAPAAPAPGAAVPGISSLPLPAAAVAEAAMPLTQEMLKVQAMAQELTRTSHALMATHGIKEQDLARYLAPQAPGRVLSIPEVEKLALDLEGQTRELMRKHNIADQDLQKYLQPKPPAPPENIAQLNARLAEVRSETRGAMKKAGISDTDVQRFMASKQEIADGAKTPAIFTSDDNSQLPALSFDVAPAVAPVVPVVPIPKVPAPPQLPSSAVRMPMQKLLREDVVARHAIHESLAGYDLSGLDLSALDLSGADFSGTLLEKTSFSKSRLVQAKFDKALLQGADFSEADLTLARLNQVSATGALFVKADFSGATLRDGDFSGADFSAAQLDHAILSGAIFDGAAMAGLMAQSCEAKNASFAGCDLSGADFGKAALQQASFYGSKLAGANFSGALCNHAEFFGAQAPKAVFADASLRASRADAASLFVEAQFPRAQLTRASWDGACLRGALFADAILDDADFSNVKADGANFQRASAKGTKFQTADLTGANMTGIDLFKGSLRHANIHTALLRNANLYGVDFEGTEPTIACIEGSNIDRTILLFRPAVV